MKTFAAWMEETLYGPKGYYSTGLAHSGREGDYFTAPDMGPAFGMLMAAILKQWAGMFAVKPFYLVECGAGEGKLAAEILKAYPEAAYLTIEKSPTRRDKIRELASMKNLRIYTQLYSLPQSPLNGVIFSNELIDAMPVHRVRMHEGALQEGYVAPNGETLWDKLSTPALSAYFKRINITLPEGYETEVNLAMRKWMVEAAEALESGFVVVIDYGRPAWQYYDPERSGGTLRMFKDHVVRKLEPGVELTSCDITADVDFTSLLLDGKEAGLEPVAFLELGTFLMIGARALLSESDFKAKAPPGMRYLVHPEGMGSAFNVLIMGKGIDPKDWPFEGNRLSRLGLPPC